MGRLVTFSRIVASGSGTQHLLEISPYAAATTWVTRRPPVFREGPFDREAGRGTVALVEERVRQGPPPRSRSLRDAPAPGHLLGRALFRFRLNSSTFR